MVLHQSRLLSNETKLVVIKVKSAESCPNNAGTEVFEVKSRLTASKENIADVDNKSLEAHVAGSETPRPAFQELNVPHRYCKKKSYFSHSRNLYGCTVRSNCESKQL